MKYILVIMLALFLAILQGTLIPLNLLFLLVVFVATLRTPTETLVLAFFGGLFLDLALGNHLGVSSLVFLVISGLIILYRRRFDPAHLLFLPLFITLGTLINLLVGRQPLALGNLLILLGLSLVIRKLIIVLYGGWDNITIDNQRNKIRL